MTGAGPAGPGGTVLACGRFEWERVVRRAVLPVRVKLVALVLATYADADGSRVRPGADVLAAVTGQGVSTVRRQVAALRELGLLELVTRGGGRAGRGRSAQYRLTLPGDVRGLGLLPPEETPAPDPAAPAADAPVSPPARGSGETGPSPVDNSDRPLAQESGETGAGEQFDRSGNTVSDGMTARFSRLSALPGERLPSDQPRKDDHHGSPDPAQPPTARTRRHSEPIELRSRQRPPDLAGSRLAGGARPASWCRLCDGEGRRWDPAGKHRGTVGICDHRPLAAAS